MKPNHIINKKGVQTMTLVFDNGEGFKVTSHNSFITVSASIIGTGISLGIFGSKNRELMSRAVAEFLNEFQKNPTYLDTTSFSYIEAKALHNLMREGVEFPNPDILTMFAAILNHYLGMIDKED